MGNEKWETGNSGARIVIAGGTGFLGTALAAAFAADGHDVRILTRSLPDGVTARSGPDVVRVGWQPPRSGAWAADIEGTKALVNLTGENLAAGRWTPARKDALRSSRIVPTRTLADAIRKAVPPPSVFVSMSGSGYYGPSGEDPKPETAPPGNDFVGQLCEAWEAAAYAASGTRVATLRTGVVLERSGGALATMIPPFKAFLGGPMGSGRQYLPWIHRSDWIAMVRWIVSRPDVTGPVNAVAPETVTNREFSKQLGNALHRPAFIPIPAAAMKLLYGEMAEALLLTGQRVIPAKAQTLGFEYRFPTLARALAAILNS